MDLENSQQAVRRCKMLGVNSQAHFALGVDVRVEAGATTVRGDAIDRRCLGRVLLRHVSGFGHVVGSQTGARIPLPKRTANCRN